MSELKDEPKAVLETVPEEIDQEAEIEKAVASRAKSLLERAGEDPQVIERELANRFRILNGLFGATIKMSRGIDWTAWKNPEGGVVLTPRDSLTATAKKVYGISISNYAPVGANGVEPLMVKLDETYEDRLSKRTVPVWTARLWADGYCNVTKESCESLSHVARTGRFAGQPDNLDDLRASCRTGLDAKIVRRLTGLIKVPLEVVAEHMGVSADVLLQRCHKGSGFGTSGERGAERVAEAGVAEMVEKLRADILRCVGGDETAAKALCREITKGDKAGKDGKTFPGWDSPTRLTQDWQVKAAIKKLESHPMFGRAAHEAGDE